MDFGGHSAPAILRRAPCSEAEGSVFIYTRGIGDHGLRWTLRTDNLARAPRGEMEGSVFIYTQGIGGYGTRWISRRRCIGRALKARRELIAVDEPWLLISPAEQ